MTDRIRPREHCGDLMPGWVASHRSECVLPPGHQGSHADDRGARWWYDAEDTDWRQRAEQAEELLRIAHDTSNKSEAERARAVQRAETAEHRLDLAHQARRAKEHQLDDIRRALCDAGYIRDDDPYSHADLADVIRQTAPAEATLDRVRDLRDDLRDITGARYIADALDSILGKEQP